jgi:rhodanese-related sulfurtransferase
MKYAVIALAIIVALVVTFFKRQSMEAYFSLPPDQVLVLDVRSKAEFDAGHFSTAVNIPHNQIAGHLQELEPFRNKQIVVYCHSGNRSAFALKVLKENGFEKVVNAGGYEAIKKFDTK